MERMRTTGLLLLVLGLASMAATAAVNPGAATTSPPATTTAAPAVAAAGETVCSSCLKCPCGCSPLAGAWVAKLDCTCSSWTESIIQTFKFAPINDGCTKFVVNSQAVTRPSQVAKFWPDACDQTEFVGVACKDEWQDVKFTAISYGVKRCEAVKTTGLVAGTSSTTPTTTDKIVFIAVMTGKIKIPDSCLECDQGNYDADGHYAGQCQEPKELQATIYVSYYDAAQDVDHDGFPDWKCDEAVLCLRCDTCLKRVELMEPCEVDSKSYTACLTACQGSDTSATGRVFIRNIDAEQRLCFVLTVQGIRDVKRATIRVNGADVVTLFPFPPDTQSKDGDCEGLLSCGCFYPKDCVGSWKNKKHADIIREIEEGKARVVICTNRYANGEIEGNIGDS